jgi:phosphopantothenoylcysteine decarboxylase/phosphopantothenate--cysteine ligase
MNPINGKTILLGITGSIAAYKAADLASKLAQSGAVVHAILTEAATKFISPLTLQSVTGQRAYTDADLWGSEAHVLHVGLAHQADLFVIAPASATTLAKLANGLADNLLSLTALAYHSDEKQASLLLAPAMDAGMFSHPATQENIHILEQRGAILIGPEEGHLASGLVAKGRMTEPPTILGQIRYQLSRSGSLAGKKVVVTAGGTQEEIDPVRYITNRSSGKQGYALAQAALDAGADVTLISTPTSLIPPVGVQFMTTRSAIDMAVAVSLACKDADALLMAAAVADFRPAQPQRQKIKKESSIPALELERTDDILSIIKIRREKTSFPRFVLGFAAETQDLLANAQAKLAAKGLDLIAINDVSAADAGFEVETNRIMLLWANGEKETLPLMSKFEAAERIVEKISTKLSSVI